MMNRIQNHPTSEQLSSFSHGQLPDKAVDAIATHLGECDSCTRALEAIPEDELLELARSASHRQEETFSIPVTDGVPPELASLQRYRVLGRIGQGGMGDVYRAEHRLMQRVVALKVINSALINKPEAISRFRNEVRAAASFSHPNIVSSFDADNEGDLHFLVMELVEGTSLAEQVASEGPLPIAQVFDVIEQTALGLSAAFEHGMAHRDIKPQNLMQTSDGVVKILDFGLARFPRQPLPNETNSAGNQDDKALLETSAGITGTRLAMGTPDYVAPEQARDASKADTRSDIYSLGCTAYHLLVGHPPFPDGNALEKISQHLLGQPINIRNLRPDLPEELASLIERMMKTKPGDRFQTPGELLDATEKLKANLGQSRTGEFIHLRRAGSSTGIRRKLLFATPLVLGLIAIVSIAPRLAKVATLPSKPSTVLVVAPNRLYYPDLEAVEREINRRGVTMRLAAPEPRIHPVSEIAHEPFDADLLLMNVDVKDYNAIVFIGGHIDKLKQEPASVQVNRIITSAREHEVQLGGLCVGLEVLRNCGIEEVREMLTNATEERLMTFDGITTAVDTVDTEALLGRLLDQQQR